VLDVAFQYLFLHSNIIDSVLFVEFTETYSDIVPLSFVCALKQNRTISIFAVQFNRFIENRNGGFISENRNALTTKNRNTHSLKQVVHNQNSVYFSQAVLIPEFH
jgi:hypothetical protein